MLKSGAAVLPFSPRRHVEIVIECMDCDAGIPTRFGDGGKVVFADARAYRVLRFEPGFHRLRYVGSRCRECSGLPDGRKGWAP